MDRDTTLRILSQHKKEFKHLGVKSLALFGSTARNESTEQSDIDLLVEFEKSPTFDTYMEAKFYFEDLLNKPVDLVIKDSLKPGIRPYVEAEAIDVAPENELAAKSIDRSSRSAVAAA